MGERACTLAIVESHAHQVNSLAGAHEVHQEGERTGLQLDSCSLTHARTHTHHKPDPG